VISVVLAVGACSPALGQNTSGASRSGLPPAQAVIGWHGHAEPFSLFLQWASGAAHNPMSMLDPHKSGQLAAMIMSPMMDAVTKMVMLESMMNVFRLDQVFGPMQMDESGTVAKAVPAVKLPGFPTQSKQDWVPNTVTKGVSVEAKKHFFQAMMMSSPLSMRDMVGIMAHKMPVADDLSFDDAVEAMKLRANEVNFKLVGENHLWKDVRAISGDDNTPRVEIFQFCDAMVGRQILDYVPEFVVFLPCRVALLEDADRKLWVMTLDWDVGWLDYVQNPNSVLETGLRKEARRIREALQYIMEGAATGDF